MCDRTLQVGEALFYEEGLSLPALEQEGPGTEWTQTLRLTVSDDEGVMLVIEQTTGTGVTIIECRDTLEMSTERWRTAGLTEGSTKSGLTHKRTSPNHPKFLHRLKRFLKRNFVCELELVD